MAKRMWYHNVPSEVLRRGDAPGSASYRRNAQFRAYTAARDDPALAASILKSSMPAPMLDRVAMERTRRRSMQAGQHLVGQDIEPESAMSAASRSAIEQRKKAEQERLTEPGGFWSGVGDVFASIPRKVINAGKTAGGAIFDALDAIDSVRSAPIAAGRASGEPELGGVTDFLGRQQRIINPDGTVKQEGNFAGEYLSNFVSLPTTLAQGVLDWFQGAQQITGYGFRRREDGSFYQPEISPQQQADMRRRGLEPESAVDRFSWYYQDWREGFKGVSDAQIRRAIDAGATPQEAEAAREFLVSGVADDPGEGNLATLSKPTQEFARKVLGQGADSREGRIVAMVDDDAALQFGGTYADAVGLREPGTARNVVTAIADLVGTWYADPLGLAGDAVSATRAAMWGVQADRFGDVARIVGASHPETNAPLHFTGQVMNEMLEDVENVYLLTRRGEQSRQAGRVEDATRDIAEATRITERFRRLHPDMLRQWDAFMQTRSGAVQEYLPRARESMERESARALERKRELMPLEAVSDGSRTPAWSIRNNLDIELTQAEKLARLAPTRAQLAEDMELLILQEAMATGRPMWRGKVILPGRVTMGARARQTMTPIFDAIARQDTKLSRALRSVADNPRATTTFDELAGGTEEADLTTGYWATNLPRRDRSLSAAFGRVQSMWEKSATGRNLSLYSSEGTETFRRLLMHSGMPRRQAYALVNKWSMSTPAERWGLWREFATSAVESGGLRDTAAKRAAVEFYTKGTVSTLDHAARRGDEQALARAHEKYATGDRNTIQVEGREMAAGILPSHMADGVTIPSMRDLKVLTGRVNFLNRAIGLGRRHFTDSSFEWLRTGTRLWKSNVTSTTSNLERQIGEGVGFLQVLNPLTLLRVAGARHVQALDRSEQRLIKNRAIKGARRLRDELGADEVKHLEQLQRDDPNGYRRHLVELGRQAGLADSAARALALVSENTEIAELVGMSRSGLFLAGPIDVIRRGRLALNDRLGSRDIGRNTASWHEYIDRLALENITQAHLNLLNTQASANRTLMSGEGFTGADTTITGAAQDARTRLGSLFGRNRTDDEIVDAARAGAKMRRANLRPNAWTEVATDTEMGRVAWADELERWLNDEIGHDVLRRLAYDHLIAPRQRDLVESRLLDRYRREALNSPEVQELARDRRSARLMLAAERRRRDRGEATLRTALDEEATYTQEAIRARRQADQLERQAVGDHLAGVRETLRSNGEAIRTGNEIVRDLEREARTMARALPPRRPRRARTHSDEQHAERMARYDADREALAAQRDLISNYRNELAGLLQESGALRQRIRAGGADLSRAEERRQFAADAERIARTANRVAARRADQTVPSQEWEQLIRDELAAIQRSIGQTQERIARGRLASSPVDFDPARSFARLRAEEESGADPRLIDMQARQAETGPIDEDFELGLDIRQLRNQIVDEEHYYSDTVEDMAAELLDRNDRMKMFSARMNHDADGRMINENDSAGLAAARHNTAQTIVDEARHLLGLHPSPIDGEIVVDESLERLLERIFQRKAIRSKDLRGIPDEVRPPLARRPEYIPALETTDKNKVRAALNRAAAIQYDTFVGRPMAKLWMQPNFQAQMHEAYQILEPVADALIERGMDPQGAALFLEHTASQYATRAVFFTTDNPMEHSGFVELADNHLMFVRSMEDFFRRLGDVISINPGKVARSWQYVEAGITSGAMYQVPGFSEEDDAEWFFTYPGSALAARIAADVTRSLGWGDAGVKVPVYSGANAPVRYLNPTLANPIGTSSNPVFALPLRAIRDYVFPDAWAPSVNEQITAVEGGEEGFATKTMLRSLMPTWASRVYDGLDWQESNAKLMSAFYAATQAADAAGIIPDESASPDEREDASHAIRQLAINNLIMRAIGGLFLPSSPWIQDMRTPDTPQTNVVAMRNGVQSLRGEWFEVLEDYSRKFGPTQGLGRAHAEWARRYPKGRGIVNPESYTVGTYKTVNPDPDVDVTKSIPRTDEMVDFFAANRALSERYGALVPLLVPPIGDRYFDTEANQLLFQMGIIEKKGMEEFARDVRTAQNISDYFRKLDEKEVAVATARSEAEKEAINLDWYDFQRRWETAYPASARKRDAGSDPDYIHDTLATSIGAFVQDENLPPEMAAIKPAVAEMYADYQAYRTDFFAEKPWNQEPINKAYWNLGDSKWMGTDMEPLWRSLRVYEGRN